MGHSLKWAVLGFQKQFLIHLKGFFWPTLITFEARKPLSNHTWVIWMFQTHQNSSTGALGSRNDFRKLNTWFYQVNPVNHCHFWIPDSHFQFGARVLKPRLRAIPSSDPGKINFPGTWVLGVTNPFEIIEILQVVSDIFEKFERNEIHDFFEFLKSRFRNNYSSANPWEKFPWQNSRSLKFCFKNHQNPSRSRWDLWKVRWGVKVGPLLPHPSGDQKNPFKGSMPRWVTPSPSWIKFCFKLVFSPQKPNGNIP